MTFNDLEWLFDVIRNVCPSPGCFSAPEGISTKLGLSNYVGDPIPYLPNIGAMGLRRVVISAYA